LRSASAWPITLETIPLAMLGMVEGNGHPYSWSAIFNGYDAEAAVRHPYPVIGDAYGAFGCLQLCGTAGHTEAAFGDTFYAFNAQLCDFIKLLRTGERPFPFAETVEPMSMLIPGTVSRERGGELVRLEEIK